MQTVLLFTGHFQPDAFAAFVRHRAARLDLAATVLSRSAAQIRVVVSGAPELIEAFEMACSLGPLCCLVRDVTWGAA